MREILWTFQDQGGTHVVSEEEIMEIYYPWWCDQMTKVGKAHLISPQSCIEDWVVVHWAWRDDPPPHHECACDTPFDCPLHEY